MKIAICDDEMLQLKLLSKYCISWFDKNKLHGEVNTFFSSEAFLFNYEDAKNYDIILLNIQMKELSGINLTKKLRNLRDDLAIIFITSIEDFVFEGYHVQAVDYILKPIDEKTLSCTGYGKQNHSKKEI